MTLNLINLFTYQIEAEITYQGEIIIFDEEMFKGLEKRGIVVSEEFKHCNQTEWRVYPHDNPKIFTEAFKQFYFTQQLQKQGYIWREIKHHKISSLFPSGK